MQPSEFDTTKHTSNIHLFIWMENELESFVCACVWMPFHWIQLNGGENNLSVVCGQKRKMFNSSTSRHNNEISFIHFALVSFENAEKQLFEFAIRWVFVLVLKMIIFNYFHLSYWPEQLRTEICQFDAFVDSLVTWGNEGGFGAHGASQFYSILSNRNRLNFNAWFIVALAMTCALLTANERTPSLSDEANFDCVAFKRHLLFDKMKWKEKVRSKREKKYIFFNEKKYN